MKLPKQRYKLVFVSLLALAALLISYDLIVSSDGFSSYLGVRLGILVEKHGSLRYFAKNGVFFDSSGQKFTQCQALNPQQNQFKITLDRITYPNVLPLYHNKSIDFECLNSSPKIKTILMWTKFKGSPLVDYGFGTRRPFELMKCPVTNCELTNDREKLNTSDLVLFHLRNQIDFIPKRRKENQRFVHVIYESPFNCHLCAIGKFESAFNFSASYREDSDFSSIYWTDAALQWDVNDEFDDQFDWHGSKTQDEKFAAMLASNCNSQSRREEFVGELSRFIPVDIFGKCGKHQCPSEPKNCREYIARNYKFYLAFENSLCQSYVTEKFFDALKFDIIPVVLGRANYSYYVPKSGFINALDFGSPKELAGYLVYLASNKTAYNSYFKWKKFIRRDESSSVGGYLCEMCIKLQLEDNLGRIERKELSGLKSKFGLQQNCLDVSFFNIKYLNISNITQDAYSFFMSPER